MTTKILGADLKAGQTIKHPAHNRIYAITDIEEADSMAGP
jgi:hypothetical protein